MDRPFRPRGATQLGGPADKKGTDYNTRDVYRDSSSHKQLTTAASDTTPTNATPISPQKETRTRDSSDNSRTRAPRHKVQTKTKHQIRYAFPRPHHIPVKPVANRYQHTCTSICVSEGGPTGTTIRPPTFSCATRSMGMLSAAAPTWMASYGPFSFQPFHPSPVCLSFRFHG